MSKVLFKHELFDAWENRISSIRIMDKSKDNVLINDDLYTISNNDLSTIKDLLNNNDLYEEKTIIHAPVMDGTIHKIKMLEKEIKCNNLWYWSYKESYNDLSKDSNKEDIKYTLEVVSLISTIQEILDNNEIDFYILDDEEE